MNKPAAVAIAGRPIGPGHPPYVVAEMSGNHNHDLKRALAILDAAAEAGADALKLQTYTADTMTIDVDRPEFRLASGLWAGHTLHSLYDEAHTPWDWHGALFARGAERGITVFSTPFDASAVDFLEGLRAPAYKIASFEATDLALIEAAARTGKPLVISTGIADLGEIAEAVATARAAGCRELILLHCISAYPAPPSESNLRTIPDLAHRFGLPVGLSDHTMGTAVAVAAVALGACFIEKHFTLRRADGGPDASFSLEPPDLRALVEGCRTAFEALGGADYTRAASEEASVIFRRSLYVVEDVRAGEALTAENVRAIRPGYGLPPKHLRQVLGRTAARDLKRGEALAWEMVGGA